jgi:molybdopterin-guanine dinucleotide biosynthesis protein A
MCIEVAMTHDSSTDAPTLALVLLAGGRGERLGGQDKGLLRLDGDTLVERLLARFASRTQERWIIANRHLDTYRQLASAFGAQVIADDDPGFQGPLMGLLTGLRHATCDLVLVLPCDAARLPDGLLDALRRQLDACGSGAVCASVEGRLYPVCCLLRRDLLASLERAFAAGERSPARWLASVGVSQCDLGAAGDAACWSINTPDELFLSGGVRVDWARPHACALPDGVSCLAE